MGPMSIEIPYTFPGQSGPRIKGKTLHNSRTGAPLYAVYSHCQDTTLGWEMQSAHSQLHRKDDSSF